MSPDAGGLTANASTGKRLRVAGVAGVVIVVVAVATPTHMMVPINAGTLRVVCERNSIQAMPEIAPGSAIKMMSGSSHDWKLTTMSRYTSTTAKPSP